MQWLLGGFLFACVWGFLLSSPMSQTCELTRHVVVFLPFYALLVFGAVSLTVVLWRVYTFNDCQAAAAELQEEIAEARRDLTAKGLKFN